MINNLLCSIFSFFYCVGGSCDIIIIIIITSMQTCSVHAAVFINRFVAAI